MESNGRPHSSESRAKIRAYWRSPSGVATRARISATMKRKWTEEWTWSVGREPLEGSKSGDGCPDAGGTSVIRS